MTPLLVLFANAGPPTQLKPAMLLKSGLGSVLFPSVKQQAAALAGAVAARAEPRAHALSKTEQLYNLCVKRSRHCALVLHHGDLQPEAARTLKALLREFRTVAFVRSRVGLAPLPNPHSASPHASRGGGCTAVALRWRRWRRWRHCNSAAVAFHGGASAGAEWAALPRS